MTIRGKEVPYHCFNDCIQTGCPGHIMRVDYANTSDVIVAHVDGKPWMYFDQDMWEAMKASMAGWNG